MFQGRLKVPWFLVHPDGHFMRYWDGFTTLALLFTAVVTPYEVACLRDTDGDSAADLVDNGLWILNQFVNLVFLFDMFLSFFMMYREDAKKGGGLVRDLPQIRMHYLKGWFFIDLISIIPFGLIPGAGAFGLLRMIRILRLLKLARIFRASRIYKRFQARNSLPHSVEAMFRIIVTLVVLTHWMACAWILTANMQPASRWTWLDAYADSYICDGDCSVWPSRDVMIEKPSQIYYGAIYWSVVTVTSVGYGEPIISD